LIDNAVLAGEQQNQLESKDPFDSYRKTCGRVFNKAGQSQLKYLQSSLELQQSMLLSCESVTSKQISWLEAFAKGPDGNIPPFTKWVLSILSSSVEAYLNSLSLFYESGIVRLNYYGKYLETMKTILDEGQPKPEGQ